MQRRTLLKGGLAGGALLAAGGAAIVAGRDPLRDRATVLGATIPALLDGALPIAADARAAAIARCVDGVAVAIAAMPPAVQHELDRLFVLLGSTIGRVLLAGVPSCWADADTAEVSAFLERWRLHSMALFRTGYGALHDLVLGAWYADDAHWAAIGYDGPLSL